MVAQQDQARPHVGGGAVDRLRRIGIDAEHAFERGRQRRCVGLAGVGDAPDLLECLHQAGEGEDSFVHHAVLLRGVVSWRCRSSGASVAAITAPPRQWRSEEHTSELQSLMRISYAVFCLKKKKKYTTKNKR